MGLVTSPVLIIDVVQSRWLSKSRATYFRSRSGVDCRAGRVSLRPTC